MSRTLTLDEAAVFLKTSTETVSAAIHTRGLPAAKVGRSFVLVEDDVIAWRWVFPVSRWERVGDEWHLTEGPTGKCSNHAWKKACTRAGVPWLRFHDLRHTWASWHVQSGTPLPVLQELGGWASLAMVQRYAHLGRSHVAQWAGNLGTNPVQVPAADDAGDAVSLGWLMGLEPTTTRITTGSRSKHPSNIKHLPSAGRRKAA